jgi:hypothetical protein
MLVLVARSKSWESYKVSIPLFATLFMQNFPPQLHLRKIETHESTIVNPADFFRQA